MVRFQTRKGLTRNPERELGVASMKSGLPSSSLSSSYQGRSVSSHHRDLSKPGCLLSDGREARNVPRQAAKSSGTLFAVAMTKQYPEKLAGCQSPLRQQEVGVSSLQFKRAEQQRNFECFMF